MREPVTHELSATVYGVAGITSGEPDAEDMTDSEKIDEILGVMRALQMGFQEVVANMESSPLARLISFKGKK